MLRINKFVNELKSYTVNKDRISNYDDKMTEYYRRLYSTFGGSSDKPPKEQFIIQNKVDRIIGNIHE